MLEIIKTNDGYMVQHTKGELEGECVCNADGDNLFDTYREAEAVFYGHDKPSKKTYRVTASMTLYCYANVEAASEDEAYEIARGMDGGDFTTDPMRGDWSIDSVYEAEE